MSKARDTADLSNGLDVDSSGNVWIGTSSPTEKLVTDGNIFASTGDGGGYFLEGSSGILRQGVTGMGFNTNGSERMRIDSSGNVHLNTPVTADPSNNGWTYYVEADSNNSWVKQSVTVNTTATQIEFMNGNGVVGKITTAGSATAYGTSSDYRLKTDAQPMTGASARIQALKPVNFEWISDGNRVDGFIAHEVQAVIPEAVTGTKDAMRDEEYEVTPAVLDDDGNVVTEAVISTRSVPDYQGIDQSKIVPLLTAALQEALTKIDDMETRLAALEAV